jgi:hypothetical protein
MAIALMAPDQPSGKNFEVFWVNPAMKCIAADVEKRYWENSL